MISSKFQAIIFDASNTLFFGDGGEFEQGNLYSLYYYMWQQGFDLKQEEIDPQELWRRWHLIRNGPKGDEQHRQLTSTKSDLELLFKDIDAVELDQILLNKLEAVYYEAVVAATQALPKMQEVLATLSKNYKLAVLSNTRSHYFIEESIRRAGLLEYFEVVVTSERVGWRKPEPRIFGLVWEEMGLEPTQTIMVGDSLEKDVAGAKALGAYTIWLSLNSSSTLADANIFPDACLDAIAKNPLELLTIIESL